MKNEASDFTIDRDRLDYEWERQAELYHKYARRLAQARADYTEKKRFLEAVEAELDYRVRKDPEQYGLSGEKKPTDTAVNRAIARTEEYKKAQGDVTEAYGWMEMCEAAVWSMTHKKAALEHFSILYRGNYYAEPSARHMTESPTNKSYKKGK